MKPEFPVLQIDSKWEDDIVQEFFGLDRFYYSNDQNFYYRYFHDKKLIDAQGRIFKVIGKRKVNNFWTRIGLQNKFELLFTFENQVWNFEKTKSFLISKINELKFEDGKKVWLETLESASTIKELLEADI